MIKTIIIAALMGVALHVNLGEFDKRTGCSQKENQSIRLTSSGWVCVKTERVH